MVRKNKVDAKKSFDKKECEKEKVRLPLEITKEEVFQDNSYALLSKGIVAIFFSIAAYLLTAFVAFQIYHPDVDAAIIKMKELLVIGGNPEPMESFLFQLGVLTIPIFLLGFLFLLTETKLSKIKWGNYFTPISIVFVLFVLGVLYFGFHAPNPNYVEHVEGHDFANSRDVSSDTNFKFYFAESVLIKDTSLYLGLIVPLIIGLIVLFKLFAKHIVVPKFMQVVGWVFVLTYIAIHLFQVYHIFSFDFPYTWENKYDFNVIYYPSTQVYAGSPMLVDGFACNYGLYAHFLNPIFQIFGLNVAIYTKVMALLILLTFALTLTAMVRMVKSKLFIVLGFSTLLFLCLLLQRIAIPFDAIFAMFPVRQMIPALTLCLASFYLTRKNKILYFSTFIFLGFGVLWNPEFGMVSLLAWTIMLCYTEFAATNGKAIAIACAKHIAVAIISVMCCSIVFSFVIYLQYGALPKLTGLFNSMIYFGGLGVGMLPMTLVHPWNFVVLIYIIGLTYAIQALFNKSTLNAKSAFILLLSIMGIGLFTYFQGRSHNWNLIMVSGNAVILLVMFADMLLEKIKIKPVKSIPLAPAMALIAIVVILGFSCVDLFLHQKKLKSLKEQRDEKKANLEEEKQIKNNIEFIKHNLPRTTEKIYVHTSHKFQSLYFDFTKKRSAFNPSTIDIFTVENCTRLKDKMLMDSSDVFLDNSYFYYPYVQKVNAATCATYSVDTANEQMAYMKKRTYSTLEESLLAENQNQQVLLYEKFNDDTASLNRRIDYAVNGKTSVDLGQNFSIEVIFFVEPQAYPAGTLFSNHTDSTGIWFLNNGTPGQYQFRWNKNLGVILNFEPLKWHYLVVQMSQNILVFCVDGRLVQRYVIPGAVLPSNRCFHIANEGRKNLHFTGAISEILVKTNYSSPQEIQARQNKMQALTK